MVMAFEISPVAWQHWCYASLALFVVAAIDADLRERRIPNLLVVLVLLAGLVLNSVGPANGREGAFAYFPGAIGVGQSLLGVLAGLLLFLPLHLLRAMGAGDVKFMAALGAYTGPGEAVSLALMVLVAGGVLAIALTLLKGKTRLVVRNLRLIAQGRGNGVSAGFDPATQTAERMPYALAFGLGLSAYGYWRHLGHPPLISF